MTSRYNMQRNKDTAKEDCSELSSHSGWETRDFDGGQGSRKRVSRPSEEVQ